MDDDSFPVAPSSETLNNTGDDDDAVPASSSNDSEWEVYTIPSYTRWFSWNDIHEWERKFFKEFFDGTSGSKTPEIYKAYRDFIINKYRENPGTRLTFTDVRKFLIGDVTILRKIFDFLDAWGLINFQAASRQSSQNDVQVVFDGGIPSSVRVVLPTQSRRALSMAARRLVADRMNRSFHEPVLASHKDVFCEDTIRKASPVSNEHTTHFPEQSADKDICNNCRTECTSNHMICKKAGFCLCMTCFEEGNYGLGLSAADFKYLSDHEDYCSEANDKWTDQETLLLLEGAFCHGDDWKKIAEYVKTKSEVECIKKLIHLPFGEQFMEDSGTECNITRPNSLAFEKDLNKQSVIVKDGTGQNYEDCHDFSVEGKLPTGGMAIADEKKHSEDGIAIRPCKIQCLSAPSNFENQISPQIAVLSTIVGPYVITAAAEASVVALCQEDPSASWIGSLDESKLINHQEGLTTGAQELNRKRKEPESMELNESKVSHLQTRAAIATAFGTAAAHAKILADQEEREMQIMMSIITENQLKKLHYKVKHFEELERIMEKEHAFVDQARICFLGEHTNIIQNHLNVKFSSCEKPFMDK